MRDGKTYRLRRGIDKVTLSVHPEKFVKRKFDKALAKEFEEFLTRKEWGSGKDKESRLSVHKVAGIWDDTPLIQYWVPLSGASRVIIMLNMMRMYNFKHGLEAPKRIALWDNNIVPPHVQFEIKEFIEDLCELKQRLIQDAQKLNEWVFGEELEKPIVSIHQLELAEEAIGLDVLDVREIYRHTRAYKTVRISNTTGTVYLNGPRKEQFKFYQKGLGVLRGEFTINDSDVLMHLREPREVETSLMMRSKEIAEIIGIPRAWWQYVPIPEKEELWQLLSSTLGIDLLVLKRVVDSDTWQGTSDNELLTRKLLRRRLIERVKPGVYVPTRKLILFARMLETLEEPSP